jgi:hypothetical protein
VNHTSLANSRHTIGNVLSNMIVESLVTPLQLDKLSVENSHLMPPRIPTELDSHFWRRSLYVSFPIALEPLEG